MVGLAKPRPTLRGTEGTDARRPEPTPVAPAGGGEGRQPPPAVPAVPAADAVRPAGRDRRPPTRPTPPRPPPRLRHGPVLPPRLAGRRRPPAGRQVVRGLRPLPGRHQGRRPP